MNFKTLKSAIVASALMFAATSAQAGFIISGGSLSTGILSSPANALVAPLGLGASVDGYVGSEIYLGSSEDVHITWLGYEAFFDNEFIFEGTELFDTNGDQTVVAGVVDSTTVASVSAGLLSFAFETHFFDVDGATSDAVTNGDANSQIAEELTFVATCYGDPSATSCNKLLLFFDDTGPSVDDDDNHDDMVVLLRVPEPATLALLGLGLIGLGYSRKKA